MKELFEMISAKILRAFFCALIVLVIAVACSEDQTQTGCLTKPPGKIIIAVISKVAPKTTPVA
jgi:hypothetical protein